MYVCVCVYACLYVCVRVFVLNTTGYFLSLLALFLTHAHTHTHTHTHTYRAATRARMQCTNAPCKLAESETQSLPPLPPPCQVQLLTATRCNTPQHTATHCSPLQHTYTATHCNKLQHTATRPLLFATKKCSKVSTMYVAVCCSVSVLQCVAV